MKTKNEIAIQVNGAQAFMGREIPVVLGGFGPNAKCICDKTAAEIHEMETKNVRARITDNPANFRESIDFINLKKVACQASNNCYSSDALQLLTDLGYTKMQVSKAEHIYILSERGYAKLVKIMDTPKVWEVYEHLLDEYFTLREEKRQTKIQAPELPPLSSINNATKIALQVMTENGVDPAYKLVMLREALGPYGVPIPDDCVTVEQRYMDQTTIAKQLGVLVASSGNPSSRAIGGILAEIGVSENEVKRAPYTKNGHSADNEFYAESVVGHITSWPEDHGYPSVIRGKDGRNQNVRYEEVN